MTDSRSPGEEAGISPAVAETSKSGETAAIKQEETAQKADTTEVAQADSTAKEASDEKPAATEPVGEAVKSEESSQEKATNGDEKKSNGKDAVTEKKGDRYEKKSYRDGGRNDRGKYSNGYKDHVKKKNNDHEEYEKLAESSDPNLIREQVEFYFTNSNLRQDNHMFFQCEGPFNRPVSIKHLCNFKRMRRFVPYTAVVAALRDSTTLDVIDDGDDRNRGQAGVKRKIPIVVRGAQGDDMTKFSIEELFYKFMSQENDVWESSAYVKGFGDEAKAGQLELEQFFKPYGSIMVKKRRDDDGDWKGSVFVEFESEEAQKQFLALDPKPTFKGNELEIKSKKEYHEAKCKEKGIDPYKNIQHNNNRGSKNNYRGRGNGGRGGRGGRGRGRDRRDDDRRRPRDRSGSQDSGDSRDWNGRRDRFQKSRDYKSDRRDNRNRRDNRDRRDHRDRDSERRPNNKNKRKADDSERDDTPKKTKVDIKEDA